MKFLAIAAVTFSTFNAIAFEEGHFICGANNEYSYSIKKVDVAGATLPYVEITTSTDDHKVNTIKGLALHITTGSGEEILALGSITMELKAGRPKCAKPQKFFEH